MYTSYYANVKNLPAHLNPIAVSIGLPKWWQGERDKRLAPSWAMMKSPRENYDREFKKQLEKLDARQVYDQLGDNAVLLCYEVPNDWCHRRMVAEWFENELGIVVPEYGLDRKDSFPYAECDKKNKGKLYSQHANKAAAVEEFRKEVFGTPEAKVETKKVDAERQMTFFDLL